ncbi:MAG: 50S ribosomal protein L30 [Spirochaetaceae bacterium]|nr:50S ribosomal protein L30 [Spirochaetaceae bacterium]RKX78932.1 MAG: 50S ribosomal protein L30 [Spirochaetota bacterium]RKX89681.1 MAG: 50S ribosomal protein L30 [Spirochaetota bacterium]RKX96204.1 MAG: 50S ribosomal protein L30 [Spirochaetota bacterium]
MAKKKYPKIRVKLVRSTIGRKPEQRKTVKALGLRKLNSTVEREANDAILGMVRSVSHLVEVEEL